MNIVWGEGDYICVLYYCIYEFVYIIVLFIYRMCVYICAALYMRVCCTYYIIYT